MLKLPQAIKRVTARIIEPFFIQAHKASSKDFSRDRVLTFPVMFMQILRKTVKSLQVSLNELFMSSYINSTVSASAYTQARKKFKHTAFIELNDDIVNIFYDDDNIKKWRGYRCIGADGSKIILPEGSDIKVEYGSIAIRNQSMSSQFSQAMFECYYDVLNHMAIKCKLAHGASYEVNLAIEMLDSTTEQDLLIYDRGYASYEFLATLTQQHKNYLVRCPISSFKAIQALVSDTENWSKIVTLKPPSSQKKNIKEKSLPREITVRFISVILSTGEVEILATSLMDTDISRDEFKWLYGMRWGVETFFSRIKGRLCLENFTGKTAESVKQDFWSTIFISNFETLAKEGVEEEMNQSSPQTQTIHEKKVNAAVSFNVIKNMAFEIFTNNRNQEEAVQKMILLFKTNPVLQRSERSPPRRKISDLRAYNFLRRVKKMIF
jgi:Transposase DDE domain